MDIITIRVIDGDTFVVRYHDIPITCRLAFVDCPERKTPFYEQSKEFVKKMIEGKTLKVEFLLQDRYKRYIANVWCEGKNIAEELVANGFAYHIAKYSNSKKLSILQSQAQEKNLNIWSLLQ